MSQSGLPFHQLLLQRRIMVYYKQREQNIRPSLSSISFEAALALVRREKKTRHSDSHFETPARNA